MVENNRAKVLCGLLQVPDKQLLAGHPTRQSSGYQHKTAVIIDVTIPADRKTEKYQELEKKLEQKWKPKDKVVPVIIAALAAVTPKLKE